MTATPNVMPAVHSSQITYDQYIVPFLGQVHVEVEERLFPMCDSPDTLVPSPSHDHNLLASVHSAVALLPEHLQA